MNNAQLDGLLALKLVAEKRNFAAAAAQLGVSASAMSQIIKQLEARLGATLLIRTTRTTALTEAGEKFLKDAAPAIETLLHAMEEVGPNSQKASGLLKLNIVKLAYKNHVEPLIASFAQKYPDVSVECFLDDAPSDVFEKGFDAGIRISDILAKDLVAVKIFGPVKFVVAASPKYLNKMGRPKNPKELLSHRCLVGKSNFETMYDRWEFEHKGKPIEIQVKPSLIINDPNHLAQYAVGGLGVFYTTEDMIAPEVKAKKLEIILGHFSAESSGYYLYYPNRTQAQPKLRAFIDHVKASAGNR